MPAVRTDDSEHKDPSTPSKTWNRRKTVDHVSQAHRRQSQSPTEDFIISSEGPIISSDSIQPTSVHPPQSKFVGPITVLDVTLHPTVAFDTFWRFAAERQAIDDRRRAGEPAPWTNDKILQKYFFCNTFRVLDKGCQFLIKEVIEKGSQQPEEIVFRVILFNLFTKIETWQLLDQELGPLKWGSYNHDKYAKVLSNAFACGIPLYTEAFIKPAPHFGHKRNYENHLYFLEVLMDNKLYSRLLVAPYMADVYEYLYSFPSMGSFTAYQLMLNLSYSKVLNFHRDDFVVSGPGSVSGLRKIFGKSWRSNNDLAFHQDVMRYFVDSQDYHFKRLGLHFSGLGPKKLPMDIADVEHTLCEVDKYCRAAHPGLKGARRNLTRPFHSHLKPAQKPNPAYLPKAWNHPARHVPRIRQERELHLEKRYQINYIKTHRDQEGQRQYLVYWVGYPDRDATWEFEASLVDEAPSAIQDYLKILSAQK